MLRMPRFDVVAPETVADAVVALARPGARILAGGTDLLPNLKHRLESPERLISLHRLRALRDVVVDDASRTVRIGTAVGLAAIAADRRIGELFPSLALAAGLVAGPQIRNSATLGGNIHLDTRCRWVNQTELWRSSLGGCLKAGGDVCHVVDKGRRCVAALSSDCVPVLVSLEASIVLASAAGARVIALEDYFHADGVRHTGRRDDELATEVRIPMANGPRRATYVKWRPRGSIDFPLVSVALRFDVDDAERVTAARVVTGVLGARPRIVALPEALIGRPFADPETASLVADAVFEQCKPLANVPYDPEYRRHLSRVLTRRAIEALGR